MATDPALIAFGRGGKMKNGKYHLEEIGAAYPHEVGNGLTVVVDYMPRSGVIVLLEPEDKDLEKRRPRPQKLWP